MKECVLTSHFVTQWNKIPNCGNVCGLQDSAFQKLRQTTKLLSAFCTGSANCWLWRKAKEILKTHAIIYSLSNQRTSEEQSLTLRAQTHHDDLRERPQIKRDTELVRAALQRDWQSCTSRTRLLLHPKQETCWPVELQHQTLYLYNMRYKWNGN